jgi:S-DNA-T family DNA segregation ATPase FtsK/SpoIIIE
MKLLDRIKKEHWKEPLGVLMILFAIWMLVSFAGYGGKVGDVLHENLTYGIGYISYLLAFIIGYWGVSFFTSMKVGVLPGVFGSVCLLISGLMLLGLFTSEMQSSVGVLGEGLDTLCKRLIGSPGLFLAGLAFLLIGITLSTELTFRTIFRSIYRAFRRPFAAGKVEKKPVSVERKKREKVMEEPSADQERPIVIFDELEKKAENGTYLRKPDTVKPYIVPPLSLLDRTAPPDEELAKDMLQGTARTLERSFDDFNIDARVLRVNRGPVITRYEVEPGPGVKVSKFVNLSDDLALVLRATRVRVVAPVPGQGVIGIEVPNERIAQVGLREVLESQEFRNTKAKLPLPLGKDISGKPVVVDLAEMPHLLIAGTTGSGKSVFLNSMIASMLFRMTPDELRILMVDPKRVELNRYNKIPHLLAPVVIDIERTPAYLKWALREVEKRYKRLANLGVRNIEGYNRYIEEHPEVIGKTIEEDNITHGRLPFVVIIIDELADLMVASSAEVEASITRLAQIARAAGVHMLVSTQRPSVNVVTGSIKANLPCRLSFRLASKVDSRTILDMNGAENLLGKGDMLFLDMNAAKPIRIQGCFVSEIEVERLVDFIRQHVPSRETEIDHIEPEEPLEDDQDDSYRELYNESVRLVLRHQIASTSFLQRRLNVSYERALQLLGDMEAEGVVGPSIGDEPREILVDRRSN